MTATDNRAATPADATLGELVAAASRDLSSLLRQEVELAKLEVKRDVVAAGKGAGGLGVAGFAGLMALLFLSVAGALGLGQVMPVSVGFVVVGGVYLVLAGLAGLVGIKNLHRLRPPTRTIETLKDDAAWAKHPTITPTRRT